MIQYEHYYYMHFCRRFKGPYLNAEVDIICNVCLAQECPSYWDFLEDNLCKVAHNLLAPKFMPN